MGFGGGACVRSRGPCRSELAGLARYLAVGPGTRHKLDSREPAVRLAGLGSHEGSHFLSHASQSSTRTRAAVLTVRALRSCIVYWDKRQRFVADKQGDWKSPRLVTLDGLTAGEHTLEVFVANSYGPAALLAYCDALHVRTGPGWEDSVYGTKWLPALTVDDVQPPVSARHLDSPATALKRNLSWLVPMFLAFWGATYLAMRQAGERIAELVVGLALPLGSAHRLVRFGRQ